MDVQLYVYDLTRGMARAMSRQLLGIHIEAVYHTSLVFGNIEYFYGRGVQTCYPGSTHHGQPMEIVPMGTTELPMETILDYLESLKETYTAESYDLFEHNCNNFTNDFGMFLVGQGIPEHITNLPKRVLETPFGQMLKPQIDASMRSITQAPVQQISPTERHGLHAEQSAAKPVVAASSNGTQVDKSEATNFAYFGSVMNVDNVTALENHLQSASTTASTIFFTSSTCAPCGIAYPMYDRLAEEHSRALFVKVDISNAQDIAMKYQIRATPTFMTFSRGQKQDEWAGADPNLLKANVERLIQQTFPPHPHTLLQVPTLQFGSLKPVTFTKTPPLDKLKGKLDSIANDTDIAALSSFIEKRDVNAKDARLPDLGHVGKAFRTKVLMLPLEVRFAAVDLLRCAMADPRVSGFFAEEKEPGTVPALLTHVNGIDECPHNLRLVTIQLACNLFTSKLYVKELMRSESVLAPSVVQLITASLLDVSHSTTRVASASLAFNLAAANYRMRREEKQEGLDESAQVELAASIFEALTSEANADATKALLMALGYLLYCAPEGGELMDLCKALEAASIVKECGGNEALVNELSSLLM